MDDLNSASEDEHNDESFDSMSMSGSNIEILLPNKDSIIPEKTQKVEESESVRLEKKLFKLLKNDPRLKELYAKGFNRDTTMKLMYRIKLEHPEFSKVQFTRGQFLNKVWRKLMAEILEKELSVPSSVATDDKRYDEDFFASIPNVDCTQEYKSGLKKRNLHHSPVPTIGSRTTQLKQPVFPTHDLEQIRAPARMTLEEMGKQYLKKNSSDRRDMFSDEIKKQGDEMTYRRLQRNLWYYQIIDAKPVLPLPTLILRHHSRIKKELARRISPDTYDVNYYDNIQKAKKLPKKSGWKSKPVRFPEDAYETITSSIAFRTPYEAIDKAADRQRYPGKVSKFKGTDPCFRKLKHVGAPVGPADYEIKSSIKCAIDKVTSLRGPYDVFSGPRDKMLHGYHKTPKTNPLIGPGQYFVKETVHSRWSNPYNRFKGKIAPPLPPDLQYKTGERNMTLNCIYPTISYIKRPGPGHYYNTTEQPVQKNKFPFNSGTSARPTSKWTEISHLSPLSYDLRPSEKLLHDTPGNGAKSDFLSTAAQTLPFEQFSKCTERLRGKDIPLHERLRQFEEYE